MKNIIVILMLLVTVSNAVADDLYLPKLPYLEKLTDDEINQQPRYIVPINNRYFCLESYSAEKVQSIPYLSSGILNLASEKYYGNAEAYLIAGIKYADREIVTQVLVDYPDFLEQFDIARDKCHKTSELVLNALMSFHLASEIGSPLADDFLVLYRQKLGDEVFNKYKKMYYESNRRSRMLSKTDR